MTTSCRDVIKSIERQLRASHAIGKFIVDGVIGRVVSVFSPTASRATTTNDTSATAQHSESSDQAPTGATTTGPGLPIPSTDFALLTSAEVVDLISRSNDAEVAAIGAYERAHRRRRLVLEAVAARGAE